MLLSCLAFALCASYGATVPTEQKPLGIEQSDGPASNLVKGRPLYGRFLHVTDFHPDEFYKPYSSSEKGLACHRGEGQSGVFGAENTRCDSPITLVNATFQWISDNLKDSIDFVIWTGDSARHDSDDEQPRSEQEVERLNDLIVNKFVEVFGKQENINDNDPTNDLRVPIVPTFGNNDIMPHNILIPGPNRWTKRFSHIWKRFIPEEQRHGFERGGWFYVEVIPSQLAVFSLNTMYFFNSNSAVDGCAKKSEPGYEHMEWLRIQLELIRQRGMKAVMIGHVPPARAGHKSLWDKTCWQKYTLWMQQYRDVVVGSVYGHMNIEHFMLQDFNDIKKKTLKGRNAKSSRIACRDDFTAESHRNDYLTSLRSDFSQLPDDPGTKSYLRSNLGPIYDLLDNLRGNSKHSSKKHKFLERIGGKWGERYSVSLVSGSVVPNYFPALRVIEYNISGLEDRSPALASDDQTDVPPGTDAHRVMDEGDFDSEPKRNKKKKEHHKHKKPKFIVPNPPSKLAPPGPAYSPQTFSWLSYTQYFANLTRLNNDISGQDPNDVSTLEKWHEGEVSGKQPHKGRSRKRHQNFEYEIEYDTKNDSVYGLKDLSVRSYIDLAARIGEYKPENDDRIDDESEADIDVTREDGSSDSNTGKQPAEMSKNKKHKKKKKHHGHRKAINRVWFTFVRRALVGARDDDDLHEEFGQPL